MTAILVMFQVYGCNSYHRIIGPVNAYLRPSCYFFPCFHVCLFPKSTFTYINHIPSSTLLVVCIYHFSGLRLHLVYKISIVFTFSHVKAYVSKIDLAVHPRVIILSNYTIRLKFSNFFIHHYFQNQKFENCR